MYKLVSTYLKPRSNSTSYINVDISLMTIHDIQNNYLDGYIELSNQALDDNVFLTIQNFRQMQLPYRLDHTFEYWLTYLGNKTILEVSELRPNYVTSIVKARNAIQSDFSISYCNRKYKPDNPLPIGGLDDLYLQKPFVSIEYLQKRMLATVNGYLHPVTPYYDGIAIVGGGSLVKNIGDINVGILSFAKVGDVHMKPITEDNLFSYGAGINLSDKCIVNVDMDLRNKSVIVVLGGYPLLSPELFSIASDELGIININTRRFDILTHVNKQMGHINLEPLGFSNNPEFKSLYPITKSAILSDLITKKYLTLPQSFIIVVDTPELTIERTPVVSSGLPGVHVSLTEPNLPIIDSNGRIMEYWITPDNNVFTIYTTHDYYKRYNYETMETYRNQTHNLVMPVNGFQNHSLEYLKITSVKLVQ